MVTLYVAVCKTWRCEQISRQGRPPIRRRRSSCRAYRVAWSVGKRGVSRAGIGSDRQSGKSGGAVSCWVRIHVNRPFGVGLGVRARCASTEDGASPMPAYATWPRRAGNAQPSAIFCVNHDLITPNVKRHHFWCPFLTRRPAVNEVKGTIQDVALRYPNAKLSVIAHSNGTYIITKLLESEHNLVLNKLVFCGSIVRRDCRVHAQVKRA